MIVGSIPVCIDFELVFEVFRSEARACFFDDNGQPAVVQQECRARGARGITRSPFIRADIVELCPQDCVQQILRIELVFHA